MDFLLNKKKIHKKIRINFKSFSQANKQASLYIRNLSKCAKKYRSSERVLIKINYKKQKQKVLCAPPELGFGRVELCPRTISKLNFAPSTHAPVRSLLIPIYYFIKKKLSV